MKSFAEEEADLKAAFWKSVNDMEDGKEEDGEGTFKVKLPIT